MAGAGGSQLNAHTWMKGDQVSVFALTWGEQYAKEKARRDGSTWKTVRVHGVVVADKEPGKKTLLCEFPGDEGGNAEQLEVRIANIRLEKLAEAHRGRGHKRKQPAPETSREVVALTDDSEDEDEDEGDAHAQEENPIESQSESEEEAESEEDEASTGPHGGPGNTTLTWGSVHTPVAEDTNADTNFKPELINFDGDPKKSEPLALFSHFMPDDYMDDVAARMDAYGKAKRWANWRITRAHLYQFLGIFLLMSLYPQASRREFWPSDDGETFTFEGKPLVTMNFKPVMKRYIFDHMLQAIGQSLPPCTADPESPFRDVKPLWDAMNKKWSEAAVMSKYIVLDESMIRWLGKHMPGWMHIPRKPRPFGAELKVVACGVTGLVHFVELQEGKTRMANKEYVKEYTDQVAIVLRLTKLWHGSRRSVIADSWFGSVRSILALFTFGLYGILNVKTAHQNYPKQKLTELGGVSQASKKKWAGPYGKVVSLTSSVIVNAASKTIFAVMHFLRKPMYLVCSCGTSLPGEARTSYKVKALGAGKVIRVAREFASPMVFSIYRKMAGAIDLFNRYRHGGLSFGTVALEDVWRTDDWRIRHFAAAIDFARVNAFFAWKAFGPPKERDMEARRWMMKLAYGLVAIPTERLSNESSPHDGPLASLVAAATDEQGSVYHDALSDVSDADKPKHNLVPGRSPDKRGRTKTVRCIYCGEKTAWKCGVCIAGPALCSPQTGTTCFSKHCCAFKVPKRDKQGRFG